jgi:hypothetical protein
MSDAVTFLVVAPLCGLVVALAIAAVLNKIGRGTWNIFD